jgi:hypothetical protein
MSDDTEFRGLVRAIEQKGQVLSASFADKEGDPASFSAHMMIDGHEYIVSVLPTRQGKPNAERDS